MQESWGTSLLGTAESGWGVTEKESDHADPLCVSEVPFMEHLQATLQNTAGLALALLFEQQRDGEERKVCNLPSFPRSSPFRCCLYSAEWLMLSFENPLLRANCGSLQIALSARR